LQKAQPAEIADVEKQQQREIYRQYAENKNCNLKKQRVESPW